LGFERINSLGVFRLLALLFSLNCSATLLWLFILVFPFPLLLDTLLFVIRLLLGAMLRLLPGFRLVLNLVYKQDKSL
jgi:hypothetical protein